MDRLSSNELSEIQEQINKNQELQRNIQKEIQTLQYNLNQVKLEEQLMYFKIIGPHLVQANSSVSKYQYIYKSVSIPQIGISLFPVWLSLECTYPRWAKNINAINIVVCGNDHQYEVLIDGLHKSLGCAYEQCGDLVKTYNIKIPSTFITGKLSSDNVSIDFSKGSALDFDEHKRKNYYIINSEDDDMVINQVKIKYILSMPIRLTLSIDTEPVDILKYI